MLLRYTSAIGLSIVLSFIVLIEVPYAWMSFFAAIPFIVLKSKWNAFVGFAIGILSSLAMFLEYPLHLVSQLARILGAIAGFPPEVVLMLFPLLYGLIFGLSSLFWVGVEYEKVLQMSTAHKY